MIERAHDSEVSPTGCVLTDGAGRETVVSPVARAVRGGEDVMLGDRCRLRSDGMVTRIGPDDDDPRSGDYLALTRVAHDGTAMFVTMPF